MNRDVGARGPRNRAWIGVTVLSVLLLYGAGAAYLASQRAGQGSIGMVEAVVYAVGDIGGAEGAGADVAEMLSRRNLEALLTLGDHVSSGTAEEFEAWYGPTFGASDGHVRPAPGDRDYGVPGAAGYFGYFGEHARMFRGAPYYAYSLGGWRVYALNSEIGESRPGEEMYEWLRSDLEARSDDCVLAYWHRPVEDSALGEMGYVWRLLAAHGTDIVLMAHSRNYQRWSTVDGINGFVVGTGGSALERVDADDERVRAAIDRHHGALELRLTRRGAEYAFIATDDRVLDSGQLLCRAGATAGSPPAPTALRSEPLRGGGSRLRWEVPSGATDIIGYLVIRGTDVIGFTPETSFDDTALPSSAAVLYSVRSVVASGGRSPPSASVPSEAQVIGYSDHIWAPAGRNPSAPTIDKPQSKLWYNDDAWWGILYRDGSQDAEPPGYYIHRLDERAEVMTTTGVAVDERDRSHADVLWDEDLRRLYVVSTSDPGPIRLYRFDYAENTHTLSDGFPVDISDTGSETATIAKDSNGVLWVTITQVPDGGRCVDGQLCVVTTMQSTSSDEEWTEAAPVPVEGSEVRPDDISAAVAFGPGRIGVMWSNQLDGSFRFASRTDDAPDGEWSSETLIVAPRAADDHINVKADGEGRVFAVVKTSLDDPSDATPDSPLVTVWVREADGEWRSATAWSVDTDVTRPQIVVDPDARRLAVVAATPGGGGAIFFKVATTDALDFEDGLGTPLIVAIGLNNPTTSKQTVDLRLGALVLAGDSATQTYWHNRLLARQP